jgi:gluconate kinase
MIIIVFGLAASGKTYVGRVINKHFNIHHEDADQWLSGDMKQYISEKKVFTLGMLENLTSNIIANIERLVSKHSKVVISQALYREKNRDAIKKHFPANELLFLQVEANDDVIHQRMVQRGDWVLPDYAASMRLFFQPMQEAKVINNNVPGEEALIEQLKNIPELKPFYKPA